MAVDEGLVRPGREGLAHVRVYNIMIETCLEQIGLDGLGFWVFMRKYVHGKEDGLRGYAWPGFKTIKKSVHLGYTAIKKLMGKLQAAGLLDIEKASDLIDRGEITLDDLQAFGIKHPLQSIVYTVHDFPPGLEITVPTCKNGSGSSSETTVPTCKNGHRSYMQERTPFLHVGTKTTRQETTRQETTRHTQESVCAVSVQNPDQERSRNQDLVEQLVDERYGLSYADAQELAQNPECTRAWLAFLSDPEEYARIDNTIGFLKAMISKGRMPRKSREDGSARDQQAAHSWGEDQDRIEPYTASKKKQGGRRWPNRARIADDNSLVEEELAESAPV